MSPKSARYTQRACQSMSRASSSSPKMPTLHTPAHPPRAHPWMAILSPEFDHFRFRTSITYQNLQSLRQQPLHPNSQLFRQDEKRAILISDPSLVAMITTLCLGNYHLGSSTMSHRYLLPYLQLNSFIVAIIYLQHTHPSLPHYQPEAWTFIKGSLATIYRDFGWIGKHVLHGNIDYHVIHHLFSRIPSYHAVEATKAVIALLGDKNHAEKHRYFLWGI